MRRLVFGLVMAAMVFTAAVGLRAAVSQVHITSLGASGDKWRVFLYDSNGNFTGAIREKSFAVVSPYYDSGENAYVVPLTVFGFLQSQINVAASAVVTHYVPGSGSGCSGGYCPMESLIEVLD